jgi:hypothetical protein
MYVCMYVFIYSEASAVAQAVSNNTVISEQCIGNVKESYCTFSQFHVVNLEKGRTNSFRTDDVRKDMSI